MVTLPVIEVTGVMSVTVAPRNFTCDRGPRRLVTNVVTTRWRSTNQRNMPRRASTRKAGPSRVDDAPPPVGLPPGAGCPGDGGQPVVGSPWVDTSTNIARPGFRAGLRCCCRFAAMSKDGGQRAGDGREQDVIDGRVVRVSGGCQRSEVGAW